ncbi:carbamate kinase [Bovifimicola ammoniilytica]|jgi:carbamate kinase|uniref:carbamate kinase n=1 Tax=Bovifimicola ammoniilytica TaxID=2981720 RepID=UPI0008204D00|nr:carbamate kinase [Bovifimicola ammoniilytica]MCU6752673.1 carbamate kinase [Bovifimicola ammoniilytica]SCJ32849.1 Carbamate kinase 1 [uncultured Eubacterium sp.]
MENKKIVVALGRNAFGDTFPKQQENVKKAAKAIADLVEEKYEVVITHSNGPQVGMIQTAMTEFSRLDSKYTVAPMSVCGAMSQGYIGFDLQNAIRTELLNRGIYKPVSTIITQVRVDPFDKAFHNPTKVIGRYMTKEEADLEEHKGNYVTYEESSEGKGYRRIIASPQPIDIYEIDAIKALVDANQLVIAAGGGGIPVLDQTQGLKGASAVIEKDYTAAKLADMIDASELLILTSNDYVTITDENGTSTELKELSIEEANSLIEDNKLDAITTLPKIQAALNFVVAKKGRKAVITNLEKAKAGIRGKVGTIIS